MFDLSFLVELVNPIILGICLLVGYTLKTAFDSFPNKYIPLAALCTGTILSVIVNWGNGIDLSIILSGMISGLASTGMYELLRNLLTKGNKKEDGVNE